MNAEQLISQEQQPTGPGLPAAQEADRFRRYWVDLLVGHGANHGAPVVYEDHPARPGPSDGNRPEAGKPVLS